jgi:hypothetical protein
MKPLLVLSLFAALSFSARAQVLLTDTFDRGTADTPVALNGSSPDSATSSETWTASPLFTTNGTSANIAAAGGDQAVAYIGIPGASSGLTLGSTYTLSLTIGPASGSSWLGVGFGDLTDTGVVSYAAPNTSPLWALYNTDGSVVLFSGGTQLTGTTPATGASTLVTLTLTAGATTDLISATVNGTQVLATSISASATPDIFIQRYEDGGSFANLSLSEVTAPEPGTWAMLMLGGVALVLLARTRFLKA